MRCGVKSKAPRALAGGRGVRRARAGGGLEPDPSRRPLSQADQAGRPSGGGARARRSLSRRRSEPEPAPGQAEPEPAAEPEPEPAAAEPEAERAGARGAGAAPAPPSPPRDYEAAGAEESKGAEEVDPTVRALLVSLGLSAYESTFAEHLVDAAALPLMTVEDFVEEMDIPVTVAVSIVEAMRAVSEASAKKLAVQEVFDDIARHQAVVEAELADHRVELERLRIRRDEVPESFACPITTELMKDPVFAADGHTYERCAIAQWFERAQTSPTTNEPIATNLVPNHAGNR
ncbi:ubiquitin-protein transferase [Aureococcus anophagefferens]|nr:ubiquitin-protein transferase [Aureococcus anophagefferens]